MFLTRIKHSCGFLNSCDTIGERNNIALSTRVFVLFGEELFLKYLASTGILTVDFCEHV